MNFIQRHLLGILCAFLIVLISIAVQAFYFAYFPASRLAQLFFDVTTIIFIGACLFNSILDALILLAKHDLKRRSKKSSHF
ncbi:MAG: hypothetical protein WDA09_08795 [Bacteriovoracaceae bacterium]